MSESTTQESAIQAPREWFDGTWFEGVNAGLNGSKRLIDVGDYPPKIVLNPRFPDTIEFLQDSESSYVATFGQC
jgi:hypothetical protein